MALTTATDFRLGTSLCTAILLHNIIEGMVVALPLWYATKSTQRVLVLTFLNGLTEPLGVLIAYMGYRLFGDSSSYGSMEESVTAHPSWVNGTLAGVAGIMFSISGTELLPSALAWLRRQSGDRVNVSGRQLIPWTSGGLILGLIVALL